MSGVYPFDEHGTGKILGHVLGPVLGEGSGAYGEVHQCTGSDGKKRAIKIAKRDKNESLKYEIDVLLKLGQAGVKGVPSVYSSGWHNDRYCFVMDLFGQNLETLLDMHDGKFDGGKVDLIISKVTRLLQPIHSAGFVHQDIKPANIVSHLDDLMLIDFGMPTRRGVGEKEVLRGTPLFASSRAHSGEEPSPQDDLVSLFYTGLYLLNGDLIWRGVGDCTKEIKEIIENFVRPSNRESIQELRKDLIKLVADDVDLRKMEGKIERVTQAIHTFLDNIDPKYLDVLSFILRHNFAEAAHYVELREILGCNVEEKLEWIRCRRWERQSSDEL